MHQPRGPFIVVLTLALVAVGCEDRSSPGGATRHYWNQLHQLSQKGQDVERRLERARTPTQFASALDQASRTFHEIARGVNRLPVENVDRDVVAYASESVVVLNRTATWAQQTAALTREFQALADHAQSPEALAEAFIRGFFGDPTGTHDDLVIADAQLRQQAHLLEREWARIEQQLNALGRQEMMLRRRLSEQYGGEFPALDGG